MPHSPDRAQTAPTADLSAQLVLRFLLELAMLAALAYWGFHEGSSLAGDLLLGVGAPLIAAVLWGVFAAPTSARRLSGAPLVAVQVTLLALGPAAVIAAGHTVLGVVYAAVVVVNAVLLETRAPSPGPAPPRG